MNNKYFEWVVMLKDGKILTVNISEKEAVRYMISAKEVNEMYRNDKATLEHTLKRLRYTLLNIINKNINDVVVTENDIEQEIPLEPDVIFTLYTDFMVSVGGEIND